HFYKPEPAQQGVFSVSRRARSVPGDVAKASTGVRTSSSTRLSPGSRRRRAFREMFAPRSPLTPPNLPILACDPRLGIRIDVLLRALPPQGSSVSKTAPK